MLYRWPCASTEPYSVVLPNPTLACTVHVRVKAVLRRASEVHWGILNHTIFVRTFTYLQIHMPAWVLLSSICSWTQNYANGSSILSLAMEYAKEGGFFRG